MKLVHHFHDGSPRPSWGGQVAHYTRQRAIAPDRTLISQEMSGIILPVQVHPRFLPPSVGHTAGMGLGLPNLRGNFLSASSNSALGKNWKKMEDSISEAAIQTLGWQGKLHPHQAGRAEIPPSALHLLLSSRQVVGENSEAGDTDEPDRLTGELTKVFPISDPSGTRVRMRKLHSPARFHVTARSLNWSKLPDLLASI